MISFIGTLSRKDYWIKLLLWTVELMAVSALLYALLNAQNAEVPGASGLSQIIAVVTYVLLLANGALATVAYLSAIVCRCRELGNTLLWIVIALVIPFGWVIVGLLPARHTA